MTFVDLYLDGYLLGIENKVTVINWIDLSPRPLLEAIIHLF